MSKETINQLAFELGGWKRLAEHCLRRTGASPENVERLCGALHENVAPAAVISWVRIVTAPRPRSPADLERSREWRASTIARLEGVGIKCLPVDGE
jgi:hypothetical protein